MAKTVPLPGLAMEIEARIARRVRRFDPKDPKMRETLMRVGLLLEAEAKINVRREGIIDTGRLLNSIRSFIYQKNGRIGVTVGSFGIPYAAIHEFGGPFTERQRRAMFASLRERGRLGPANRIDKGVIQGDRIIERPYIRPAVKKHARRIVDMLLDLVRV